MNKKIISILQTSTIALLLVLASTTTQALWLDPTLPPPEGNASEPVNLSINAQIKDGVFTAVQGLFSTDIQASGGADPKVTAPKFCLGPSCITAWPAGGPGGVSSIDQGNGITVTPLPLPATGAVTVSANTTYLQRRVNLGGPSGNGTCPPGQAIRVISLTGSVTCGGIPTISTYPLFSPPRDGTGGRDIGVHTACFLSEVWADDGGGDVNGFYCRVFRSGGSWRINAMSNGANVSCGAICLDH